MFPVPHDGSRRAIILSMFLDKRMQPSGNLFHSSSCDLHLISDSVSLAIVDIKLLTQSTNSTYMRMV